MGFKLTNKYYVKKSSGTYSDIASTYAGVNILSVTGFDSIGKAVNVYNEQWVNDQTEDFLITKENNGVPVIIRENVDITMTFVVSRRYGTNQTDEQTVYDTFVAYMTSSDIWLASKYVGKQVHCVALDGFEPKQVKLKRGNNSYILGELKFHTLSKPTSYT